MGNSLRHYSSFFPVILLIRSPGQIPAIAIGQKLTMPVKIIIPAITNSTVARIPVIMLVKYKVMIMAAIESRIMRLVEPKLDFI